MDRARDYHTEQSKSEKERSYVESKKKKDENELIYKTNKLRDFRNKLMVTRGEMWREG